MLDTLIEAFTNAWTRTIDVLFRPFDPLRYLAFAALCWLANCTSTQPGSGNIQGSNSEGGILDPANFPSDPGEIELLVAGIGVAIAVTVAFVALIGFAIWIALLFVSSRASFMFVDGIQRGAPRLEAWTEHQTAGNALWRFRVILTVASTAWVLFIAFLAVATFIALGLSGMGAGALIPFQLGILLLLMLMLLPVALLGGLADWFVRDLAVPVMWVTGGTVVEAMTDLIQAPGFDPLSLLLYVFARFLLAITVMLVTLPLLCLCFCLFLIPGVSTVILLPILVYQRTLGMHWVASLDERFSALANMEPLET